MRAAVCFAAMCAGTLGPAAARASKLDPVVRIDSGSLSGDAAGFLYHLLPLVQFVGNDTLAVGLVSHRLGPLNLVRRGVVNRQSPYVLRVALFDAATGRLRRQAEWPTNSALHSGLVPGPGSRLLVLLGNSVRLYSEGLQLLGQLDLPGPEGSVWLPRASPSGRHVLFISDSGAQAARTWAWVETDPLRLLWAWSSERILPTVTSASDGFVAFRECRVVAGALPCRLIALSLSTGSASQLASMGYGGVAFVAANLLLSHGMDRADFSIIDVRKRRVVYDDRLWQGGQMTLGSPVIASGGGRYLFPVLNAVGTLEYLYVSMRPPDHLRALRVRERAPVNYPLWFLTSSRWLALSPDGTLLAVMPNFQTVLIYKLPPPKHH